MISIVTPVLNGACFIEDNIRSILQLSIPHEHIVVDGGSNDGTIEIVKKYKSIKILHQIENTGMYGAIDLGFKKAKGNYVSWVNCDDRIIPSGYEKMYNYGVNKQLDFICSDGLFEFSAQNKKKLVRGTRHVKYFLKNGYFPFSQPSSIFSKDLYFNVNGFNFLKYKICGDMDLFYRMAKDPNSNFGYVSVISSIFLKHGNSLGDKNTELGIAEKKGNGIIPKAKLRHRFLLKIVKICRI